MKAHQAGGWRLNAAAALAILLLVVTSMARAQTPVPVPKDAPVDYWQPLWMQREL
jgi:hypothetical protein